MYSKKRKAVFLDKDGTLIINVPYNADPDLVVFQEHAMEGLKKFREMNFLLFIVSNQSGIALGLFKEDDLMILRDRIQCRLKDEGIRLDGFYYCPHHPEGKIKKYTRVCGCRKPSAGMLFRAAEDFNIDLAASWMIGDVLNDVEAGNRASCHTVMIDNGNETVWDLGENRVPDFIAGDLKEASDLIFAAQDIIRPADHSVSMIN